MFRIGTDAVLAERRTVREFTADPVDPAAVRRAIAAALTAPAPHHSEPWRFAVLESAAARTALLDAMLAAWRADLTADGFTAEQIARRVRRGEPLRRAPLIIVPCLVADAAHAYPDERRNAAEQSMFLVAMGAAVQNLLVGAGHRGPGLVLGVEHAVLPAGGGRRAGPARRAGRRWARSGSATRPRRPGPGPTATRTRSRCGCEGARPGGDPGQRDLAIFSSRRAESAGVSASALRRFMTSM